VVFILMDYILGFCALISNGCSYFQCLDHLLWYNGAQIALSLVLVEPCCISNDSKLLIFFD